jgi:solute:Na+ symporter, SSS family
MTAGSPRKTACTSVDAPMWIEFVTLGVYFVLLLGIGAYFARFNRNLSDFVRGGAKCTWWMIGSSSLMAGISAFTFTGNGSAIFEAGLSPLVIYVANVLGFVIGGLGLAAWFRQTRGYTYGDVIRGRFGPSVERTFIGFNLLYAPFASAIQLWALALFVSSAFGLPLTAMIVLIGVITLAYSTSGGMWGVIATDVMQAVLLYGMTILIAVLCVSHAGGLGAFWGYYRSPELAEAYQLVKPAGAFPQDRFTWQWLVVAFVMQLISQLHLGGQPNRYLAAKDGREAARAAWLGGAMMFFGVIAWFIPPMMARFLYAPEVMAAAVNDPATTAYAVAARHVLPNGLLGLLIAAMFAATMSSIDTGLNAQTGVIVNNLIAPWRRFRGRAALPDRTMLRLCRGINILLGLLIISIALFLARQGAMRLFDAYMLIGSVITVPISLPLLVCLFVRPMPVWSFFTMFAGGMVPSIYTLIDERLYGTAWTLQERSLAVLAGACVALLLSLPFRHRRSTANRLNEEQFLERARTPVDFAREIGPSNDAAQAWAMAKVIYVMGALLFAFLLVPNPLAGRLAITALALFVVGCAAGLHLLARRKVVEATDAGSR